MRLNSRRLYHFLLAWMAVGAGLAMGGDEGEGRAPKLVVFIVVDQLRGDMPLRYAGRFGEGGFRYLIERGLHYSNAHYDYAVTVTAVGHATLATGGGPGEHGMVSNDWFDVATGTRLYALEDPAYRVIGRNPRKHEGTSPRNLLSSTIGDELVGGTGGRGRVFGVCGKDRGAILLGGHLGKAFWYDDETGSFVTSGYYYDGPPGWVEDWNKGKAADKHRGKWELLRGHENYLFGGRDDQSFERPPEGMGRTFPHPLDGERFYASLIYSPMLDELTCAFAGELIVRERLGQGQATDMLGISLSATDLIGHMFGPDSLEAEDNMLRLDRTLAGLFAAIDKTVGLDKTLIVLSADHGVDSAPELHRRRRTGSEVERLPVGVSEGEHAEGRHVSDELVKLGNVALRKRLRVDADLITTFMQPSFYLNRAKIDGAGQKVEAVERELAAVMMETPGISLALTRSDLMAGRVPRTFVAEHMERSFHPLRSGNVLIVQAPHWYLAGGDTMAAMHGSPYAYDTYVPIFFAGAGVKGGRVTRLVCPKDIAPTIAQVLGIVPPSGCTGKVMREVWGERGD